MYVDDMIPGVTFQTIENNPEYAYNRAVDELVKEKVSAPVILEAIPNFHIKRIILLTNH